MSKILVVLSCSVVILIIITVVSLIMGKKTKGSEDWEVAGRSLPVYVIVGTNFATAAGGSVLVAQVGLGYRLGWSSLTYSLILAIGLLFLLFIAKWLREKNFRTLPDVISNLYGNHKSLTTLTAVMCMIVPFGWVASQLQAFGKLFSSIMGIPSFWLAAIFALFCLILVLPSGLTSVAWTDFIFGCFMFLCMVFSVIYIIYMADGVHTIANNLPHKISSFPEGMGAAGLGMTALWFLSVVPGTVTNQMYFQRIYAAKNIDILKTGLIITAIVFILKGVWTSVMGMAIRSMNPNLKGELAMGWFLTHTPTWVLGIFSALIISLLMSTASSGVQSVALNVIRDIYKNHSTKETSDKKMLSLSRYTSIAVLIFALITAYAFPSVLDIVVASFAYSTGGLLVPIFLGFALKETNILTWQGAFGSIITGVVCTAVAHQLGTVIPYVVYGIIGSLIAIFIVSFITKGKNVSNSDTVL